MCEEMDIELITLVDDEGNEEEFEIVDVIEYEEKEYAVLLPVVEDETVTFATVTAIDDDTEEFETVNDDATLEALFAIFKERFQDQFDFDEE